MRVAILDLYDGTENLGMQSIKNILMHYPALEVEVFDVRGKCELPSLEYDIYISSGGPGSPLEGDGVWDRAFYYFIDKLWKHNQRSEEKKYALFICHSFQMLCNFLSIGSVQLRHKPSIGVLPAHKTEDGKKESVFAKLPDPFYVGDFRKYQVIQPNHERLINLGCKILALEKIRPHIKRERAIMAMRFSDEWIGTQFHPEADPGGMLKHFKKDEVRKQIIGKRGESRFTTMIENAENPKKLQVTFDAIIPTFIEESVAKLKSIEALNLV